jgi:hypothetical protein
MGSNKCLKIYQIMNNLQLFYLHLADVDNVVFMSPYIFSREHGVLRRL